MRQHGFIKLLALLCPLLLACPQLVSAQETNHRPLALGYGFVGGGSRNMGLTTGFGGEGYVYKGLGVGAEIAIAGVAEASGDNRTNEIGLGSLDASYHLFSGRAGGSIVPFLEGGYTVFFGQDQYRPYAPPGEQHPGGNLTNGFNVGGGTDIFSTRHLGVRLGIWYYGHGGSILGASFPNLAQFSFVAFRIGLTFR
jgi:hypothetical protein